MTVGSAPCSSCEGSGLGDPSQPEGRLEEMAPGPPGAPAPPLFQGPPCRTSVLSVPPWQKDGASHRRPGAPGTESNRPCRLTASSVAAKCPGDSVTMRATPIRLGSNPRARTVVNAAEQVVGRSDRSVRGPSPRAWRHCGHATAAQECRRALAGPLGKAGPGSPLGPAIACGGAAPAGVAHLVLEMPEDTASRVGAASLIRNLPRRARRPRRGPAGPPHHRCPADQVARTAGGAALRSGWSGA
jgi:hypothetical protein